MFFTIPNLFDRMIDEPVSVVGLLSVTAIITTISLFFCGIPICLEIWNRGKTDEISGFPFLMGFLGGAFWLRYGLLKSDLTMIIVNWVGVSLMLLYIIFYMYYTQSRSVLFFELSIVMGAIGTMLVLTGIYHETILDQLGFVCMTFNIINFGAPLAGLAVVFRKRSCDTLPLPLCSANLLVSMQWCLYGVLVHDKYIIIPNGAGIVLALLQISLFLVFPRREGTRAPLAICIPLLDNLEREKQDLPVDSASSMRNGFVVNGGFNWPAQRGIAIPPSRNACIEFLRSTAFNSGNYYVYSESTGSTRSRNTPDTTVSTNLSAVSSISHPELWQASEEAAIAGGDGPHVNETFNCSYNSGAQFNASRNSGFNVFNASRNSGVGVTNPLAVSHSSCNSQYFQSLWAGATASGRQSLQQLQALQIQLQRQQRERQLRQLQQQNIQQESSQDPERPPSQQEHLLSKTQFEFDRVGELDELERIWQEREPIRTNSAPDLNAV